MYYIVFIHFELYTNHEAIFSFHKLQKMSEEILECHCINLRLKLNSDLDETNLYEELNLFRIILP